MIDLTNYSDKELSLQVFNDQYFYSERFNQEYLIALCHEEFKFTNKQLEVLKEDLDEDRNEIVADIEKSLDDENVSYGEVATLDDIAQNLGIKQTDEMTAIDVLLEVKEKLAQMNIHKEFNEGIKPSDIKL
jgi:hypothetical protein